MREAQARIELDLYAVCVMPNHFHLVAAARSEGDLSRWMHWLLTTHSRRHNVYRGETGRVWQGRFKAFPICKDEHLFTVLRYVERNALRANLVAHAREWPWGSLAWRCGIAPIELAPPPGGLPTRWERLVDEPLTGPELTAVRHCVQKQRPFGPFPWAVDAARLCGLEQTLRSPGRPRKQPLLPAAADLMNSTLRGPG